MDRRRALGLLIGGAARAVEIPRLAETDRHVFRAWFTFLAEALCYTEERLRPAEVKDCSSLLRYAYREALRRHDGRWASELHLPHLPPLGEVSAAARRAILFETGETERRHFADAEHLMRNNCHRVAHDLERARPADLLFYRQAQGRLTWHSMVYLGPSHFEKESARRVVYHTGAESWDLRRPTVEELLRHPEPRWRPVAGNANFRGVYRWNLLREAE